MAYSFRTKTSLCLDRWAEIMSINPLAFNNIDIGNCVEDAINGCKMWAQDTYQDEFNIETLATYIQLAEQKIESYLGVKVAPTAICHEQIEIPYYYRRELGKLDLQQLKFQTAYKEVRKFGQEKRKFLGEATIVYTDEDGDGFKEIATLTLTTDEVDLDYCGIEVDICPTARCNNICPVINIDLNVLEGILTIKSYTWLFRKEENIKIGFSKLHRSIDGCDTDNFLDCVGVYYRSIDPCKPQAEIVWNRTDKCFNDTFWTSASSCGRDCSTFRLPACVKILDKCRGIFQLEYQRYDDTGCLVSGCTCNLPCFPPDYIEVNYISGCKSNCTSCNDCGVCDQLERTVAILAAAMLPQAFCNCTCLQTQLQYYQTNATAKANGILTYGVPFEILNNPFGQRFGEIEAYQNLKVLEEYLCNS